VTYNDEPYDVDPTNETVRYVKSKPNSHSAGSRVSPGTPEHDAVMARALLARKDGPTRVTYDGKLFDVYPDARAVYVEDGYFNSAGDRLPTYSPVHEEIIKLAAQRR